MSVHHTSWVLRHSEAEHGARLVMFVLADKANELNHAYPAVATIAAESRLSKRAVQSALRKLVEMGEVKLLDQPSQYGTRVYELPDPWGGAESAPPQKPTAKAQNTTGSASQTAPEPSSNPTENPPPLSPLDQVWAHYQATIPNGARQTLEAKRRSIIKAALKVRSVEECCLAIDGLAKSPHHNGENDRGTKYLDIRYALRPNGQRGESVDERIDRMGALASATVGNMEGRQLRHTSTDSSHYDDGIEDA